MSWVSEFRDNRKPVLLALAIFAVLALLDFYSRIYVGVNDSQRNVADFSYVMPDQQKELALPESLNTWMKATDPAAQSDAQSEQAEAIETIAGAERVGDYDVRINAVFIGRDEFALADVQKKDEAPERRALRLGDVIGQFKVITIEAEKITLLNEETSEAKELTVFKKAQEMSTGGVD